MISPHIHIPFDRITEYIDFIGDRQLNLEIYFSADVLDHISREEVLTLKKQLAYDPSLSFHGPFMDLSPGAVDEKVRAITLNRFNTMLDYAELLGTKAVVFHSGYEKWKYALKPDIWLKKSIQTWEPLIRRAEKAGLKLAIENIFEDEPSTLAMLMEKLSSEHFGICFDTGHCNLFTSVPVSDWVQVLNPYIIELHLHDNMGNADEHLPVGEGSFDFTLFFSLLRNKNCIYTVEAHTPEKVSRSIDNIINYLKLYL